MKKEVAVYFAGWHLERKDSRGAEVCTIPWERVSCINHAFWMAEPAENPEETTFDRRAAGKPPRTDFRVTSMQPYSDFGAEEPSTLAPELPQNHFAQYAHFAKIYSDVRILLSVGGWTRSGFFSEMAYTPEGRESFAESCMDILAAHPWLSGIDIDWEYFGGGVNGPRLPADEDDQGCPVWGTAAEDSENFAAVMGLLREKTDKIYGKGVKKLTACAGASTTEVLPVQNWSLAEPYLDMVNIMTYDMAGPWNGVAGHAGTIFHARNAVAYLRENQGIPYRKISIGSPLYGKDFRLLEIPADGSPIGKPTEPTPPAGSSVTQEILQKWETAGNGWHPVFDETARGAYLWNDDEASPYGRWFLSYETETTLQDKLDFIRQQGLGGIIMWECAQDAPRFLRIRQTAENLLRE